METFKCPPPLKFEGNMGENFRKFKQMFEIFMMASGKQKESDEVKIAIFLNMIGEEGLDVFNNFKMSDEDKKKFNKVIDQFESYMNPKKNILYERFLFYNRSQEEAEPIDNFIQDVRKLMKSCEFKACCSEDILRDRIVLGIRDKKLQECLISEENLQLQKTIEKCRASEVTKEHVKIIQENKVVDVVNRKTNEKFLNNSRNEKFLCTRCCTKHGKNQCPAFGKKCSRCGILNHFRAACRVRNIKELVLENEEEGCCQVENSVIDRRETCKNLVIDSLEVCNMANMINIISNQSKFSWYQNVVVSNKNIKFKLDTGAEVNILPLALFKGMGNERLKSSGLILETYGGFKVKPLGISNLCCTVNGMRKYQEFVVVDNNSIPLLGLKSCIDLNLVKRIDILKNVMTCEKSEILKINEDLFTGIGKFKDKCRIVLNQNAEPIVRPPRRVPMTIREKLKTTLDDLEKKNYSKSFRRCQLGQQFGNC